MFQKAAKRRVDRVKKNHVRKVRQPIGASSKHGGSSSFCRPRPIPPGPLRAAPRPRLGRGRRQGRGSSRKSPPANRQTGTEKESTKEIRGSKSIRRRSRCRHSRSLATHSL